MIAAAVTHSHSRWLISSSTIGGRRMTRFLGITLIVLVSALQVGCLVTVRNRGPNPIVIDFDTNPLIESPAPLAPGFNRTYTFLQVVDLNCTVTDDTANRSNTQGIEADELRETVVLEWDGQFVDIVP